MLGGRSPSPELCSCNLHLQEATTLVHTMQPSIGGELGTSFAGEMPKINNNNNSRLSG